MPAADELVAPVELIGFSRRKAPAGHRLQPSIARAPCSTVWRNDARRRNRRHSRARAALRRSGSTSAARERAWLRSLPATRRVLWPIAPASAAAGPTARTRMRSRPTSAPSGACSATPSGGELLIVLPLMKCSGQIRAIVSTISIPNHLLRSKAGSATDQPVGGQFRTRSPGLGGNIAGRITRFWLRLAFPVVGTWEDRSRRAAPSASPR